MKQFPYLQFHVFFQYFRKSLTMVGRKDGQAMGHNWTIIDSHVTCFSRTHWFSHRQCAMLSEIERTFTNKLTCNSLRNYFFTDVCYKSEGFSWGGRCCALHSRSSNFQINPYAIFCRVSNCHRLICLRV